MVNEADPSFIPNLNSVDFRILEYGYLRADRDWNFLGMISPFNRLYLVTEGRGKISGPEGALREEMDLEPGGAYLIPAQRVFDYRCDERMEKFWIHFRLECFEGMDLFEASRRALRLPFDLEEAKGLRERAGSGNPVDAAICKARLLSILAAFLEADPEIGLASIAALPAAYRLLDEHLRANLGMGLSVARLAEWMGMESGNFIRDFRKRIGITPKAWIDRNIFREACRRLLASGASVKEIAAELGFSDEFYFSRFFKRRAGLPPSAYRARNRMGEVGLGDRRASRSPSIAFRGNMPREVF
jgi:AraC-like DNA-binding protein